MKKTERERRGGDEEEEERKWGRLTHGQRRGRRENAYRKQVGDG